ncbi:centromere protein J [Anguilla rostrata]|uniref:centromere protein J n=1 Tax=Anguilla rostrata TaxID=7938 RepID=UPI0030CCFDF6
MMSSQAGLYNPETDFLARWMPCSTRAGVILNPSVDLARSLSSSSWAAQDVDDSFLAQFAPLPYSSNSSSLSVEYLVPDEAAASLCKSDQMPGKTNLIAFNNSTALQHTHPGAVMQESTGEMDSIVETSEQPPEDLMLKLEQLKEWQQQMQEKLKAHQMQQLQELLEEQQRLLGLVYVSQQASAGDSGASQLTEGDWGDDTVLERPPVSQGERQPSLSPGSNLQGPPVPQRQPLSPLQWAPSGPCIQSTAACLHPHPEEEEKEDPDKTLGSNVCIQRWSGDPLQEYDDDDEVVEDEEEDSQHAVPSCSAGSLQIAHRKAEEPEHLEDRPIRSGIGGRSRTFEELLEEQLRMEEQRLNSGQQKPSRAGAEEVRVHFKSKRPFLRRGEGLSRFLGGGAAAARRSAKEVAEPPPKPAGARGSGEPGSGDDRRRPPIQRKTTALSRESPPEGPSAPPNRGRAETKETRPSRAPRQPRVLASRQKLNAASVSLGRPRQAQQRQEGPPPAKTQHALGGMRAETLGQGSQTRAGVAVGVEEGGGGRQVAPEQGYSFEQSFQAKLGSWDMEKQRERVELGEFELLEQAAEEMSFSSNSSFVLKVLELDRQDSRGRRHHRRLSSTPVKSPKPSPSKAGLSGDSDTDRPGGALSVCPSVAVAAAVTRGDPVGGFIEREAVVSSDPCSSDSEAVEDEPEQEVLQHMPALPSSPCFSPSQGQYDKTSYQDAEGDFCGGGEHNETGDLSNHNDSTLTEGQGQGSKDDRLVFDDDDTWNDLEDAGNAEDSGSNDGGGITHDPPGAESDRALKRKVATMKVPESAPQGNPAFRELEPPPTSQLVAKLFPSLKPKPQPAPPPPPGPTGTAGDQGAGRQSRLLRERLAELEIEIERFRSENAALASQRLEREKALEALRKERAEFEQMKEEELARLEEFKKEETRKLQKERKVFEKHASAARAIPDKREREEIQALKQQLSSLQEELRRREARWSNTHSRLRQQVEALGAENSDLRDEVRALERLRISAWKRDEAEREREREKESCRRSSESTAARSKSTSPPAPLKASQPFTATARETRQVTSPPKSTHRSSSRKSPQIPSPGSGAQKQAGPGQGQPITAQNPNTPPTLLSRAGVSQTEYCEEEEEEEEEEQPTQKEITHPDGKIETILCCGTRLIVFPNGTRKEVSADGRTVKVNFFNGDVKQVMEDQRVIYYYANTQTTHTTYPDGMEVLQFPNNQIEKHFPDGRKEITFPDQTVKNLGPNGDEESVLPDGTIIQVKPDGTKVIQFNSGQREVHTDKFKRREYPDGTMKTVYADGRQETRYPNGRLRIKDKDGRVVSDSRT